MKFTPRLPRENINVSATHPLLEFGWLLGGLALLFVLFYFALAWAGANAVQRLPVGLETWIGERTRSRMPMEASAPLQRRLEPLLAALPTDSPLHEYPFRAYLGDNDQVNALALPGGNIVVFKGLVQAATSENELQMVLAHELGHFAHRDHLKGLGRGLGITVLSLLLFGQDSGVSDLVSRVFLTLEARYSREQEAAADAFAVDLLVAANGHAGGATDFFQRLSRKADQAVPYLLASHPRPDDRIGALAARIHARGYPLRPTRPLADDLAP